MRQIFRSALTPPLVSFIFALSLAVFAEAGLSFPGIVITEPLTN